MLFNPNWNEAQAMTLQNGLESENEEVVTFIMIAYYSGGFQMVGIG